MWLKDRERVLVTGGAGFIGSHLCDSLLAAGYSVICLDNFVTGSRQNIEEAHLQARFSLIEADVEKPIDISVDYIFHLASPASPVDYTRIPIRTMLSNSIGTYNCLELARKTGARLLMGSTSEVYGDPQVSPQREDYFGFVNPVGPRSCYDEGKRFAEALCKAYEKEHETDVVIVRIFNTYGRRMRRDDGRVIPNFVCQALEDKPITIYGEGLQTRSFCHVTDMIRGLEAAMFTPRARGEIINLGNPREIRIIDLANIIREKCSSKSPFVFSELPTDDPLQRRPDIEKAMRLLGWSPQIETQEGLDDVIEWFRRGRNGK